MNIKRVITCLLFTCLLFVLCGCSKNKFSKYDVCLITDQGTIEDGSFNEASYNGVKKFCDESGMKYSYLVPDTFSVSGYEASMIEAIDNGAKILICPGYMHETAVYNQAKKHPEVKFVLIDGEPHDADYEDYTIKENVLPILFAEEDAGFLAGYAAVREGFTNLSFIGGMAEDPVVRYGYGFVQGADFASIEVGSKISIDYIYSGTYSEDDNIYQYAKDLYSNGTEVIFACGGAMGRSVMKAAEEMDGHVIGVDVDQSRESTSVIFSATKEVEMAVYEALKSYLSDTFEGGYIKTYCAAEEGVGLAFTDSKFTHFSQIEYEAIYNELKCHEIVPYSNTDIGTTQELELINTTVNYKE